MKLESQITHKFQDQNIDNEEANLSNSSLRRKLFFNHEETSDDEDSFCLSPVPGHASILLQSSPPGTGIVHGTPLMVKPIVNSTPKHEKKTKGYNNNETISRTVFADCKQLTVLHTQLTCPLQTCHRYVTEA